MNLPPSWSLAYGVQGTTSQGIDPKIILIILSHPFFKKHILTFGTGLTETGTIFASSQF